MRTFFHFKMRLLLASFVAIGASASYAADIEIFPGDSFEAAVEGLNPGDTVTVHAGTYIDSGRISIGVKGTPAAPVVIQGATGEARPMIARSAGDAAQNTINIEGAEYLTIRGLEISGNGGDGINMSGAPSYITLEDLVIHDISVGINFRSSMHHITVRRNHIYSTNDTGEGLYVGCNNATCAVSESLIENNWIHDTLASIQGDGIEIKRGSYSNVIRDNVIHDTNYPCILLYGTEGNPRNIVEGNVMWNCGDSGIQAAADSVIRNNIIFDGPGNGFNSQPHQGVTPANLEFVHNTLVGGNPCIRISNWDNKQGLVFANNAVYCASSSFVVGGLNNVAVFGNVFEPATSAFPMAGYTVGRSEALDFIDAVGHNVYPTSDSTLIGAGNPTYTVGNDFNGTPRNAGIDAGAYAWTAAVNPGWRVGPGFKDANPGPALQFVGNPATIGIQDLATLTWSASNANDCTAFGDWTGSRPTSGQETVGPLSETSQFELRCTNDDGGSTSEIVTVTVVADPSVVMPSLELSAEPAVVQMNGTTVISWTSLDANTCEASDAWSGAKPMSGSETTGALTADATFALECTGLGGAISRSVTVQVQPDSAATSSTSTSSGSGAATWINLLLLTFLGFRIAQSRLAAESS